MQVLPRVAFALALTFALAVLTSLAASVAHAGEVDEQTFRTVEALLFRYDADSDGTVTETERARLTKKVEGNWGAEGVVRLEAVLAAADADADRQITRTEWRTLAEKHEYASAWARAKTVLVPMQDGTKLATDVFLPAGDGPWPTILSRTPYGRRRGGPPGSVAKGYAVVRQDMRGRNDSEGENLPFVGCGWRPYADGADTVAWIRKQPWSNGDVGTVGGSAGGITQNLMAATNPDGLVCQHITVAAASLYHHAAYVGGALRKSQIEEWLEWNDFDEKAIRLFRAHPNYDAFWHDYDALRKLADTHAPAMHVGGWFDTFAQGTVDAFVGRQRLGGEGARGRQILVMGPWAHGGFRNGGQVGALTFPNARTPRAYAASAFLARHLLRTGADAEEPQPVAYYVMGDAEKPDAPGNEWRFAAAWPPPALDLEAFLGSEGELRYTPVPGDDAKAHVAWTFDPSDPCPTVGGCNLVLPAGPMDQREVEARPDVLTFTTPVLEEPMEVTGAVRGRLFVSSSAKDTDLSIRFSDVYPDGRSFLMAEGMLRLRFRGGFAKPVPLTPGEVVEVEVACWPTSVVIGEGHRIRIAVTSSNHPRFDVNPGTGRPYREGGKLRKQENRVYCSSAHPSRILLPIVVRADEK